MSSGRIADAQNLLLGVGPFVSLRGVLRLRGRLDRLGLALQPYWVGPDQEGLTSHPDDQTSPKLGLHSTNETRGWLVNLTNSTSS